MVLNSKSYHICVREEGKKGELKGNVLSVQETVSSETLFSDESTYNCKKL